jgi:hypothetical protein
MTSIRSLQWRHGKFSRKLWQRLLAAIAERTIRAGRNVRVRHLADGVVVRSAGGGSASDPSFPWQMSLADTGDGTYGLSFVQRGLINGSEAQIDGKPMSYSDPESEEPNTLTVEEDEFGPDGVCRIYAQITVSRTWDIDHVDIVALAKTPPPTAWTDFKLIGLLLRDESGAVTVEQHAFFDLQWAVGNPGANGFGTYYRGAE